VTKAYLKGMARKLAVVGFFGALGLLVGAALALLYPSYGVGDFLYLPSDSPHSAAALVAAVRGEHPGVLVTSHRERIISFSATGGLSAANSAIGRANRAVIAANNGKYKLLLGNAARSTHLARYGLRGTLIGVTLAAGIIFLVPPATKRQSRRARKAATPV
jgi:hypothetical protein